jgi:hypothetical protein
MRFCTNCGAPTGGEGKRFCTTCGALLLADPVAPDPQPGREAEPDTVRLPAGPASPAATGPATASPPAEPPTAPAEPPTAPEEPPTSPRAFGSTRIGAETKPARPVYEAPPGSWPPTAPGLPPVPGTTPATGPASPGPAPAWPAATAGLSSGAPPLPGTPPPPPLRLRPAPPPPGNRATIWIAMAVALVVLAGGGYAVWKLVLHHGTNHPVAGPSNHPSGTGPGAAGSTPTPAGASSAPATPSLPGGFAVSVSPAAAGQPGEPQVVSFLRSYFTAINHHNYGQYASLVTSAQRPTPAQFQSGFGTTRDSHATLTGLSPTGTGVAANVTFTSHQQPSASPTGTSCTAWHITLFLESRGGGYRIGPAAPGYHARYRAC